MDVNYSPDQQKVIDLLQKLKRVERAYPPGLLEKRRSVFLASVGKFQSKQQTNKRNTLSQTGAIASKEALLQGILVTVLATEFLAGAYILRDKWLPLLIKKEASTPVFTSPNITKVATTPEYIAPEAINDPTITETPTPTPSSTLIFVKTPTSPSNSTNADDKGHPGKHLGQTPKPPGQENKP